MPLVFGVRERLFKPLRLEPRGIIVRVRLGRLPVTRTIRHGTSVANTADGCISARRSWSRQRPIRHRNRAYPSCSPQMRAHQVDPVGDFVQHNVQSFPQRRSGNGRAGACILAGRPVSSLSSMVCHWRPTQALSAHLVSMRPRSLSKSQAAIECASRMRKDIHLSNRMVKYCGKMRGAHRPNVPSETRSPVVRRRLDPVRARSGCGRACAPSHCPSKTTQSTRSSLLADRRWR